MSYKPCRHCGATSDLGARFCPVCGGSLRLAAGDDLSVSPPAATLPLPGPLAYDPAPNDAATEETGADFRHAAQRPRAASPADAPSRIHFSAEPVFSPETPKRRELAAEPARAGAERGRGGSWRAWMLGGIAVVTVAAVAALVTLAALDRWGGRRAPDARAAQPAAPNPAAEALRLRLASEQALAVGDTEAAIELAREAVRLDDHDAHAQLDLALALEQAGRTGEALVFYEAAAALAPDSAFTWRRLADAQLAAGRFAEAAQSYGRLLALTPDDAAARGRLDFALREAQPAAAESPAAHLGADAAGGSNPAPDRAARRIDEHGAAELSDADRGASERRVAARDAAERPPAPPAVAPPAPRLSPRQRFERAVALYASDRPAALAELRAVAADVPDAYYFLGLSLAENRSPQSMHRAELLAALADFQIAAARGDRYRAEAARYADQLGREYDRRRKG